MLHCNEGGKCNIDIISLEGTIYDYLFPRDNLMFLFYKVIDDLKDRLAKRREFTPPLENAAWSYGISTTYLEDVLEYWRTKYNWPERQKLLNNYPQYMTNIQGALFVSDRYRLQNIINILNNLEYAI